MLSNTPMRRLGFIVLGLSFVTLTACKSGLDERCQVTADCEDGLVCAPATDLCSESANDGLDAGEIDAAIDAREDAPDDAPDDAGTDAPLDAPPDA
jgi:hypothetical protein